MRKGQLRLTLESIEEVRLELWRKCTRRQSNGDMNPFDTVIYGPSTSNQVKIRKIKFHRKYETCTGSFFFNKQIELWWKDFHEQLEKYFKERLAGLKGDGYHNPHDEAHRYM